MTDSNSTSRPNKRLLYRRDLLRFGAGAIAGAGAVALGRSPQNSSQAETQLADSRSFDVEGDRSLGARAAAKGILYGAAVRRSNLFEDTAFAARFVQECGMLVPERAMKWQALRPSLDKFDFEGADQLVDFATQHDLKLRGHTLVWHHSLPDWFAEQVTRQNAEQVLVNHIQTVAGHYAGKMQSWDVVNEAIQPKEEKPDGFRNSPWLQLLGQDYVELAFRVAAEADPDAMLLYNDYSLDYDTAEDETKRNAVLRLLERLKSREVPVHALGLQAHLDGQDSRQFNPAQMQRFLREVADLGLKIFVTELDVEDQRLPANIEQRDRIVAAAYEDYLTAVLAEPAVIAVLTWGLSDRYSWLSDYKPRDDGMPVRPLPLDADLQPKLAWNAIARVFDQAAQR